MRYAKRVDENQAEVVQAFRDLGCWVVDLHGLGRGVPDILIAVPPKNVLVLCEVKDGGKPPSKRKLTGPEEEFHASCPVAIHIIESLEDVRVVVDFYRRWA